METVQRFPEKGNVGKGNAPHAIWSDLDSTREDQIEAGAPEEARGAGEAQASLAAGRILAWLDPVIQSSRAAGSGLVEPVSEQVRQMDPQLTAYQERVASRCRAMAQRLQFPAERIDHILLGARLHALGRAGLGAQGTRSPLYREYPRISLKVLEEMDVPRPVRQIVLQHRELNDGSGFPSGLEAHAIALDAHILGVACGVVDKVAPADAQPSATLEEALTELADRRHMHYHPAAVDACLRVFRETGFTLPA